MTMMPENSRDYPIERALELERQHFCQLLDLLPGCNGAGVLALWPDNGDQLLGLELLGEELSASCQRQLELLATLRERRRSQKGNEGTAA